MRGGVRILATGVANLEAVRAAFRRLGLDPRAVETAAELDEAEYLVLPGVGSFASGMRALAREGWVEPIRDRLRAGRPTLAICLGLQLLCEGSEEAPGTPGLGAVAGTASRFGPSVRVPQLGWNRIEAPGEAKYLRSGSVYFANSFRLVSPPGGWVAATSRYGGRFVAAVESGGVLGCQFHPELSGAVGRRVMARWLELAPAAYEAFSDERPQAAPC